MSKLLGRHTVNHTTNKGRYIEARFLDDKLDVLLIHTHKSTNGECLEFYREEKDILTLYNELGELLSIMRENNEN